MGEAELKLGRLGQVALTIEDLDKAVDFYGRLLGLRHLFTVPHMAFFDCGGVRLMLTRPEAGAVGGGRGGSVLYFQVDGIVPVHAILASRGVSFQGPPHLVAKMGTHDLWMAFFKDPSGNLLALMSEEKPA